VSKVRGMSVLTMTEVSHRRGSGRPRDPSLDGAIRAAILRLLAEVGYGALTMDAVAAEAGVGKATIYRRWRSKEDLVVDTISDLYRDGLLPPETGSLEGDLRWMLHSLVAVIISETGSATLSLLSTVPHLPALADAFRDGPLAVWQDSFAQVWARAEQSGEVRAGTAGATLAETTTALLVQRWLLTGRLVDNDYADEVLGAVVLPLLRATPGNV
jgi:AcrR family transcriptional regulator